MRRGIFNFIARTCVYIYVTVIVLSFNVCIKIYFLCITGQIILTVNGRIVQSMFSTGIDEEIFVECRLNDSSANITWTWMQYDGKANSTISKDVYSTHSSTVLKMIFSANETILSCSANSTGSAGSVILSRDIVIRLKGV